ncbi:hypothetical protein BDV27DRAFT_163459 [Aspergillus caelatus]|uniref:Ubiquitin-like protease family profile domain-containing protein n=2 Tax=Aspergillus subgen. Circumdati TaxID=2720871 RepID=A0A5N6ZM72_9EURO|nr:uncharacterized protein BDV27DRAFT_163459 [Aspergillus caelatus]KAE8358565.1 hypothetical protein BDV27DRAFT_163459 [Aspergillus caelatus]KAE8410196.1 hypothetical protein BDV36DRAFT_302975 [Aspergillus pseudocaelatus]
MASNSISIQELDKSNKPSKVEEKLIRLLSEFVDMIASDANVDLGCTPKFHTVIQQLCEKAPEVARTIAKTMQESITNSRGRKRKLAEDPSYRPAKLRRQRIGFPASMSEQKPESDKVLGGSTKSHNEHLLKPSPSLHDLHDHSSQAGGCGEEGNDVLPAGVLATMASKALATSSEEPLRRASPQSVPYTEPTSSKITTVTPTKQTERRLSSPQTEEIQRKAILTSLESITSTGQSTRMRLFPNRRSIIDLTIKATRTICHLSKHKDGVPSDVHKRVLQSLQQAQLGVSAECTHQNHWSDGSMWVQVLEMGESRKDRGTIQNMLEYIGAWEWYNTQLELAKKTVTTKKNKPVKQRGAAMHVMDQIQNRWIGGVGIVTLQEGNSHYLSGSDPASISAEEKHLQRNRISMQLNRGKLCSKLVKELGLGILFDENIWAYVKSGMEEVDNIIKAIQADAGHMKLLQILAPQLEHLVKIGLPDLHIFYKDLKEAKLLSESELRQLEGRFALEGDPLPDSQLEAEIDRLIRDVNIKVLDQTTFGRNDTIAINNGMEIPCDIFDRLRPGRWLDSWTINALMQISDKPAFVKHDLSIPLDQKSGNNVLRPIKHPLRAWATKIAKFREEARKASGELVPLVFFCPINHKGQHFSLLEINEREKVIRHYDSMAKVTTRLRMTEVVEEQFGDLKFPYEEVPTPQQDDGWSCGIRTVWNFRHLSNNLPIGSGDTVLNPERMMLEVVEGLTACVESGAMTKYIRRRRSDREKRPPT